LKVVEVIAHDISLKNPWCYHLADEPSVTGSKCKIVSTFEAVSEISRQRTKFFADDSAIICAAGEKEGEEEKKSGVAHRRCCGCEFYRRPEWWRLQITSLPLKWLGEGIRKKLNLISALTVRFAKQM
jgi:hypothetical protein